MPSGTLDRDMEQVIAPFVVPRRTPNRSASADWATMPQTS